DEVAGALAGVAARGHRVALVTDGRLGRGPALVPAAVHVTPEAAAGGPLGRLHDGDEVLLDVLAGKLEAVVALENLPARDTAEVVGQVAGEVPEVAPAA
ncbi:MAG TPA: dihydroxy-acid dehydratase, partial [Pseudonocardia sp.]|nr:dihydroxy-acid dehydratase [Pseudonocardia sp.]